VVTQPVAVSSSAWLGCKRGKTADVLGDKGVGGASKEVGAPASRIHGRSHTLTPWNKDLESSTRVETAPLTRQNYPDGPKTARAKKRAAHLRPNIVLGQVGQTPFHSNPVSVHPVECALNQSNHSIAVRKGGERSRLRRGGKRLHERRDTL